MNHLHIVPWRSSEEVDQLKDLFYSGSDVDKWRAVNRVKAYLIRGKVLHSIEATCVLTLSILTDKESKIIDSTQLRSAYSMALIKFVNGLLDPYQKSTHAIPLHNIAKMINLPSSFVEIRHIATHESLPGINILRIMAKDALIWLKENFWDKNDLNPSSRKLNDISNPNNNKEIPKTRSNPVPLDEELRFKSLLKSNLRVYRRFHRNGIKDVNVNSRNIKDEETLNYVKNLRAISDFLRIESTTNNYYSVNSLIRILLDVLIFKNVLIIRKPDIKFNQVRILCTPLLEYLNTTIINHISLEDNSRTFSDILLEYLIEKQQAYSENAENGVTDMESDSNFTSTAEIDIALKWINFLIFPIKPKSIEIPVTKVLQIIRLYPGNKKYNEQILLNMKKKLCGAEKLKDISKNEELAKEIDQILKSYNEPVERVEESTKRKVCGDKEDTTFDDDLDLLRKRLKITATTQNSEPESNTQADKDTPIFLWKPVEFYKPSPFGITL